MSTHATNWEKLLDALDDQDVKDPSIGQLAEALADATDSDTGEAYDRVDAAIDAGELVEDVDAGSWGAIRLPDSGSNRSNPGSEAGGSTFSDTETDDVGDRDGSDTVAIDAREPTASSWFEIDFSTESNTYPPELLEREQWMGQLSGAKRPFAPWSDRNPPVECNSPGCDADRADDPECECDGRFKWGYEGHYLDGEKIAMAEEDDRLDGRVFIQQASDPFVFVDGDDVRDPETGEVHPAFLAFLDHLGMTYGDVSTSGGGIHAQYRGELPGDLPEAKWEIDTEPFGSHDEPPKIEIYANKHVNVTTGDHLVGTGTAVREWNADVLEPILEANDQIREQPSTDRDDYDLEGYEPTATGSDETTDKIRDVLAAIDDLNPKRVGDRTIVGEWTRGERSFLPVWGSKNDSGTANYIDDRIWHDTGHDGGYGGPVVMAAIDAGLIGHKGATPRDVTGETWFEAVDHLRDLGFSIPKLDRSTSDAGEDVDPAVAIPFDRLDALSGDDRRRAARKRGIEIPTTRDARERLRNTVFREFRAGNQTVIDAPTALGKSYTIATEPWIRRTDVTGGAPVIHLHATTDARDDAVRATRNSSATGAVLRGRKEASPIARGDHDPAEDPEDDPDVVVTVDGEPASEWFERMCDEKGIPFSTALAIARDRNDQGLDELPPFGEEDPAVAQWDGLPRDEDGEPAVDVIHATHQFAYVPSIRSHTNLILDEQPDFRIELSQDRVRRAVSAYLDAVDAPVRDFETFVTFAKKDTLSGDAAAERDALEHILDQDAVLPREWYATNPDAHAIAPDLARAIWNALRWEDPDRNGRRSTKVYHEPPRFDADVESYTAGTWLSVVIGDDHTIRRIRATPDLSQARAVIGLDAHPAMPVWELNAGPGFTRDAVLDPTERRLWRRYERGLTTVQIGDAARPRSGKNARKWMSDDRVRAIVERLRDRFGSGFKTALATVQTEPAIRRLLTDLAGEDAETMHYGNEKSRNDFADERAGYVYGCMDPGDDMILDAIAELGLDAAPVFVDTEDGDTVREKGRTFEGDDADTAASVLASVRENHVAQAAGRYARNADDPESRATVFVDTNAAPTGFIDIETAGVRWLATDLQRTIVDELSDRSSATVRELADAAECTKEHVRKTLDRLEDDDVVEREENAGDYGADVFRDAGATDSIVDLGKIANDPLLDPNRWSLVIDDRHAPDEPIVAPENSPSTSIASLDGGDTLLDPGD